MKKSILILVLMLLRPLFADEVGLDSAILNVKKNCQGISKSINHMKLMAGINTAVTGVGTLVGGGAIATGFIKQSKDKQIASLEDLLKQLEQMELEHPGAEPTEEDIKAFDESFAEAIKNPKETIESELARLDKESRALGNARTGLMAGNTATNVVGAVVAGNNQVDRNLTETIDACKTSVKELDAMRLQVAFDGADGSALATVDKIVKSCGKWNRVDLSKINKRGLGAMWVAIAGVIIGGSGTVTSAMANSEKTRVDDTPEGKQKEKNLNTASNALAIGSTAASATATAFNASQIAAINKAGEVADECEEALR